MFLKVKIENGALVFFENWKMVFVQFVSKSENWFLLCVQSENWKMVFVQLGDITIPLAPSRSHPRMCVCARVPARVKRTRARFLISIESVYLKTFLCSVFFFFVWFSTKSESKGTKTVNKRKKWDQVFLREYVRIENQK